MRTIATVGALVLAGFATWATAEPVTYVIDGAHTHVPWEVDRFGFAKTMGSFSQVAGAVTVDPNDMASSSVQATIDLAGLRSDLPEREEIIRGDHWLKATQFGQITFRSTRVRAVSQVDEPVGLDVVGTMSLAGVEQPLTLAVTLNKTGTDPVTRRDAIGFSATGQFKRSDFGVKTALGLVGDEVRFRIEGMAVAPPSEDGVVSQDD